MNENREILQAMIDENKSILKMAEKYMDERACVVLRQRIFELEKQIEKLAPSTRANVGGYTAQQITDAHMAGQKNAGCHHASFGEANAFLHSLPASPSQDLDNLKNQFKEKADEALLLNSEIGNHGAPAASPSLGEIAPAIYFLREAHYSVVSKDPDGGWMTFEEAMDDEMGPAVLEAMEKYANQFRGISTPPTFPTREEAEREASVNKYREQIQKFIRAKREDYDSEAYTAKYKIMVDRGNLKAYWEGRRDACDDIIDTLPSPPNT